MAYKVNRDLQFGDGSHRKFTGIRVWNRETRGQTFSIHAEGSKAPLFSGPIRTREDRLRYRAAHAVAELLHDIGYGVTVIRRERHL